MNQKQVMHGLNERRCRTKWQDRGERLKILKVVATREGTVGVAEQFAFSVAPEVVEMSAGQELKEKVKWQFG